MSGPGETGSGSMEETRGCGVVDRMGNCIPGVERKGGGPGYGNGDR